MIKGIKKFSLLLVIVLFLIFPCTINVWATSKQTNYVNINKGGNLEVGDLSFSNLLFKDNSSNSGKSLGLTGDINNKSNENIEYTSKIYFYDSSYNLITELEDSGYAIVGQYSFYKMLDLNVLGKRDVKEIVYYRLEISIAGSSTSIGTNTTPIDLPSKQNKYRSYDYVIDKYDIDINVKQNNIFDVTETITAYFNVPKHGIFRKIPLRNEITRVDGTTSTNKVEISDISVNKAFSESKEGNNYILKIGDGDKTLKGEQTYVIRYSYNLGKDPMRNYDELYYNLIGTEWDTVIGNVSFSITMPKKFDKRKLGFSSGVKGSIDNEKVEYSVNDNKIIGKYNGVLNAGEGLTVRCELPEGYFVKEKIAFNPEDFPIYLIPVLFLLISILIWYKFGKDDKVEETIEIYPPSGFNSLEVGFLFKGKAGPMDVTSLLLYLANKGYIKISETEEKGFLIDTKSFKITKLKEYDGNDINEQLFFNGLFSYKKDMKEEKKTDIDEVTPSDLEDHFYMTTRYIMNKINIIENEDKILEKPVISRYVFIALMIATTFFVISLLPLSAYNQGNDFPVLGIIWTGFVFIMASTSIINCIRSYYLYEFPIRKLFSISSIIKYIIIFGMFYVPFSIIILPALQQNLTYIIGYCLGLVCVFGMCVCIAFLPRRTPYGNEILAKLKGFRNFLKNSDKEKLEVIVKKDPNYFYEVLPYAYVLGVYNIWLKKFELVSQPIPEWYNSPIPFNIMAFEAFMTSFWWTVNDTMTSDPSGGDSSSDGSSGGGSSGGGSGGGGGGSW